jgi:hypothetical protein
VIAAYDEGTYRTAAHSHRVTVRCALRGATRAESLSGKASPRDVGLPNAYARKGFSVATSEHVLTIRPSWLRDVFAPGLSVVDGMLTIDAKPALVPRDLYLAGCSIWTAAWVRQGRGTSLVEERGIIIRGAAGMTFHARSVDHARKLIASLRAVRACGRT